MHEDYSLDKPLIDESSDGPIINSQLIGDTRPKDKKTHSDSLTQELKELMKISFPVGIATLARLAIYSTDTAFLGHLGDAQLSAATLSDVVKDIASNFSLGFAYVLNQICSQAIGAGNPKLAGNWLQLCLVLTAISSIPVIVLFYFSGDILTLFIDDKDVITDGRIYAHVAFLIYLPAVMYMALRQFFQAAQIVIPATIVSLLTIGVNILLNQVLVNGMGGFGGMGLTGSPLATLCAFFFQISTFLGIMIYMEYFKKYWDGWTWESFSKARIKKLLSLALPLSLGVFLENGGWQVLTLATGRLGEVNVSAMSILYSTWGILWAFYWGFGLALQVRVGFHLGEGNITLLRKTLKAAVVLFVVLIGSIAAGCYFLRYEIGRLFNNDPAVLKVVSDTMPFLSLNYFIGCLGLAALNILEGMSRNKVILIVTTIGMWGICIPLFFYLTYYCQYFLDHGQLKGVWTANAVSELFKCVVLWVVIFRSDLEELSRQAKERSEVAKEDTKEDSESESPTKTGQLRGLILSPGHPNLQSP